MDLLYNYQLRLSMAELEATMHLPKSQEMIQV